MKVAIIGSGASGLTAIKCCIDEGLHPVCFERQGDIGGLWNYAPGQKDDATVYRSTVINTSKEMMCYSDFPIPKEFPNFMHHSRVQEYFRLYAERFGLLNHIHFSTKVLSCTQAESFQKIGQWRVLSKDLKTDVDKTEYFDGVLVCTGHHAIPHLPLKDFPGIDNFKGKYIHSHEYRDHKGYEDLRVVVIGIGNSGADIAVELSRHSEQVFLSTRRGAWIFNRISDNGMPGDIIQTNRFSLVIPGMLPVALTDWLIRSQLNKKLNHVKYGLQPKHGVFSQHPNASDDMPNRIITGSIKIKTNVARFTETSAIFDDGTEEEVDAVVFATGYSFDYPFLDEKVLKIVENDFDLYKYMWPTTVTKHTLAIIGGIQPWGAVNPISEMQCRWATRVFKGDMKMPSLKVMREETEDRKRDLEKRYVKSRRHTMEVDYIPFMDELASQISCKPKISKYLLTDPKLAMKLIFGPTVSYQYRLDGPGQWPEARKMIMSVMDRVLYPLKTRTVEEEKTKSSTSIIFVILMAILLSWLFGLL